MSYTYQNFASLPVNLNRQAYGALDISQVFTSLDDLKYYVSKGEYTTNVSTYWFESDDKKVVPYPYAGQYLALVDNDTRKVTAYILEERAEAEVDVAAGKYPFIYKEVGITPIGDDKTVDVDATGKITLHGIDGKDEGTFVPKLKDGILVWETPSTITVEGLQTAVEDLQEDVTALEAKDSALQSEIDAVEETVGEHTTAIGELEQADVDLGERIDAHDERLEDLESIVNGTGTGDEHVDGLVDKVSDLETAMTQAQADITDRYTKSETDTKIAEAVAAERHFSAQVVTDKSLMTDPTVLYLFQPEGATGTDVYEQYIVIDGEATCIGETSVDLKDYAKSADVTAEISGEVTKLDAAYKAADKALGERIDGVQQTINGLGSTYATIEELNKKAAQDDLDKTNEDLSNLDGRVGSLEAVSHSHSNKDVLDGITTEKVAQWDKAEENLVKSVKDGELTVSEAGELSVVQITKDQVKDLTTDLNSITGTLSNKVDKKDGYGLISDADLAKLTNLSATGTLDATKIDNLGKWISDNRETVGGLLTAADEQKLDGIAAGAQVNIIEGVSVAGGQLTPDSNKIVDIPFATNSVYGVVKGAEAVNAVMINSSNQMEVHSLNVNKLVQDEGDTLILNGGHA